MQRLGFRQITRHECYLQSHSLGDHKTQDITHLQSGPFAGEDRILDSKCDLGFRVWGLLIEVQAVRLSYQVDVGLNS